MGGYRYGEKVPRADCPACGRNVAVNTAKIPGRLDYRAHDCPHGAHCSGHVHNSRCWASTDTPERCAGCPDCALVLTGRKP